MIHLCLTHDQERVSHHDLFISIYIHLTHASPNKKLIMIHFNHDHTFIIPLARYNASGPVVSLLCVDQLAKCSWQSSLNLCACIAGQELRLANTRQSVQEHTLLTTVVQGFLTSSPLRLVSNPIAMASNLITSDGVQTKSPLRLVSGSDQSFDFWSLPR